MDEGLLNDLLECSVCLERLDTSSRVLPCQHTFCLKCLKVIVESHKELRCPECRILVEVKLEELPPNVLLMRILEGMRNSAPRKGTISTPRSRHQAQSGHGQTTRSNDVKQPPPHARALFDYVSKESGDLSFKKGETIFLHKRLDPFWYQGECSGRSGMFPVTFVQILYPIPIPTALCKALYDFRMSAPDEEGCLAFDKGAIITVHRRVDENWAEGRIEDRVGIFPIAFVELNTAARQLMNTPPLNRPVPPTPESNRPTHSEHRHHGQHSHRYQQMSMSTPTTAQSNYQNVATMSQSHPNYQQMLVPTSQILVSQPIGQSLGHGLVTTTAVPRNILEPTQTKHMDLIHNISSVHKGNQVMALQNVSRINESVRTKYEYNSTPVKTEATYQNTRIPISNITANSSDSSSNLVSSTTPNSSSNTSSCESAEPSLPSSPDNTDRQTERNNEDTDVTPNLNTSMGVLSLNESSTATNTSLNVSLPAEPTNESTERVTPCSSKNQSRSNGPESMLNFGLGLQSALSPSHGKDGYIPRSHREKRHSLTPSTHLNHSQHSTNRHSAEILATSLLDQPERDRATSSRERERDKRRRSCDRNLPATYIALYPYKPQKPDELELKKGGIYTVTERCRDGWYKGFSERTQRCGVFPGNYVAPASVRPKHDKQAQQPAAPPTAKQTSSVQSAVNLVPLAPPREGSPIALTAQPASFPWSVNTQQQQQQSTPKSERSKEKSKAEKSSISSGVSLMKRLAAMKKCKSPPPVGYSMDNPVFDDGPGTSIVMAMPSTQMQPVHVRSGSCPSQLLGALPNTAETRAASHRIRTRERPSVLPTQDRPSENPWQTQHRKSQSLDVTGTRRDRHHSQNVKERFRCIVPYPPNSEYELELKVDDIVMVHKKRGDGWYRGTLQRTGQTGLFPASFVQSCPTD